MNIKIYDAFAARQESLKDYLANSLGSMLSVGVSLTCDEETVYLIVAIDAERPKGCVNVGELIDKAVKHCGLADYGSGRTASGWYVPDHNCMHCVPVYNYGQRIWNAVLEAVETAVRTYVRSQISSESTGS